MTTSFYNAASGLIWQEKGIDVTANNISNVSTDGYKADKTSFADLIYTNVKDESGDSKLKVGHGSKVDRTNTIYDVGNMDKTSHSKDYALVDGRQFFAGKTANGIRYTRDGRFQNSKGGDGKYYLADSEGNYVLDSNLQPIPARIDGQKQKVGVFTFKNLDGLLKAGNSYYMSTERSGAATAVQGAEAEQGYLESSTTDLANEISNIIMEERAYQMNSRVVQMSDEVMQTINSLR